MNYFWVFDGIYVLSLVVGVAIVRSLIATDELSNRLLGFTAFALFVAPFVLAIEPAQYVADNIQPNSISASIDDQLSHFFKAQLVAEKAAGKFQLDLTKYNLTLPHDKPPTNEQLSIQADFASNIRAFQNISNYIGTQTVALSANADSARLTRTAVEWSLRGLFFTFFLGVAGYVYSDLKQHQAAIAHAQALEHISQQITDLSTKQASGDPGAELKAWVKRLLHWLSYWA